MSLIKCKECGKEYSDESGACIHCGYPTVKNTIDLNGSDIENQYDNEFNEPKKKKPVTKNIIIAAVILFVALTIGVTITVLSSNSSKEDNSGNSYTAEEKAASEALYGYNLDASGKYADLENAVLDLSDLLDRYDGTQTWFDDMYSQLCNIETLSYQASSIVAPDNASEFYDQYVEGAELVREGALAMKDCLYSPNKNIIDQSCADMVSGCSLMEGAIDGMDDILLEDAENGI